MIVALLGGSEIGKLLRQPIALVGVVVLPLIVGPAFMFTSGHAHGKSSLGVAQDATAWWSFVGVAGVLATYRLVERPSSRENALGLAAAGWVVGPIACLLILHQLGAPPTEDWSWRFDTPILLAILPLWGGDTAAYFVGRAFGKTPLAPKISPKKTVEGAVANLLACIAVAAPLGGAIGFPWLPSLLCGLAAGVLGQAGDLFESWVKRRADLKDSGTLLPGHGGILDRVDSLLFTAPAVALILLFS